MTLGAGVTLGAGGAGAPCGRAEASSVSRRTALTESVNRAYDQVTTSRSRTQGRSRRLAQLAGVLNGSTPLLEGAVALYRSGVRADGADVVAVREMARAVLTGRRPAGRPPPALQTGAAPARAVRDGVRVLWPVVGGEEGPAGPPGGARRSARAAAVDLVSRTAGSAEGRAYAVRLALCMGIAELVREHLPYARPYWVLLTVAIVLKPDFGSVFARGAQRSAGTLVGVLIGAGVLALVPHDGWVLIPIAVAAAAMPWALGVNYGLFVVAITPAIVILLDLTTASTSGVVTARLLDTLVGSGIVLLFGYALWPGTWRSSLDLPLHRVVAALDAFVAAAFTGGAAQRAPARRRTFRALTELQVALQRQLAEPPPVSTRAAAWWPVMVQLERVADGVIEAAVAVDAGAGRPGPAGVDALRRDLARLDPLPTAPVTNRRGDGEPDDVLAPVAREVDAASRLLARTSAPARPRGR